MGDDATAADERAVAERATEETGTGGRHRGLDRAVRARATRRARRPLLDRSALAGELADAQRRVTAFTTAPSGMTAPAASVEPVLGGFERLAAEAAGPPGGQPEHAAGRDAAIDELPSVSATPPRLQRVRQGTRRRARTSALVPVDLGAEWVRQWGSEPVAPPDEDRRRWRATRTAPVRAYRVTVASALSATEMVSLEQLRQAGMGVPAGLGAGRLFDLVGAVVYVGPGFGLAVDRRGALLQLPVGWSFYVAGVPGDEATELSGIFFGGRRTYVPVWFENAERRYLVGEAKPGTFGLKVQDRRSSVRKLRAWSERDRDTGVLFVVSPSYWDRRGTVAAVRGGPGRLSDAVSRCVVQGYLEEAIGKAIKKLDVWDVAKEAFTALVELLLPIPLPGGLEDGRRQAMAVGMAIWGDANATGDVDAAARMLAPEIADMVVGKVVAKGGKGAARGVRKVRDRRSPPSSSDAASSGAASPGGASGSTTSTTAGQGTPPAALRESEAAGAPGSAVRDEGVHTTAIGGPIGSRATGTRALRPSPGSTPAGLQALIGPSAYSRAVTYARARLRAFRTPGKRDGAVHAVKGAVLESTVPHLPAVQAEVRRAAELAEAMGVDPATVTFVHGASDRVGPSSGELGDGLVVGVRHPDAAPPLPHADVPAGGGELVVFTVIESKAAGSIGKIGRESGQWGQAERTRARLETGAVTVDGRRHEQVLVPADFGRRLRVVAVVPKGTTARVRRNLRDRLRDEQGRDATVIEAAYTDDEAFAIAESLLEDADAAP